MQRRMIPALNHNERVARKILAGHEPGRRSAILQAAHTEPAALSERVARKALVPADDLAVRRFDRTRISGQPGFQEIAERTLADETDAGRVALGEDRQAALARDRAYLGLAEQAHREIAAGKGHGIQHVQEVALVLRRIYGAQQPATAADACVMTGRKARSTQSPRVGQAQPELDLAVAKDVRIRRATRTQFSQEMRKDAFPVLRRETDAMQRDAEFRATAARIQEVGGGRAVAFAVVLPVRHEEALDLVSGIQ